MSINANTKRSRRRLHIVLELSLVRSLFCLLAQKKSSSSAAAVAVAAASSSSASASSYPLNTAAATTTAAAAVANLSSRLSSPSCVSSCPPLSAPTISC